MKASELMIGDIVILNGEEIAITAASFKTTHNNYEPKRVYKEDLWQMGFTRSPVESLLLVELNVEGINDCSARFYSMPDEFDSPLRVVVLLNKGYPSYARYVHEVQRLYNAVTGKRLILSPKGKEFD